MRVQQLVLLLSNDMKNLSLLILLLTLDSVMHCSFYFFVIGLMVTTFHMKMPLQTVSISFSVKQLWLW